jgi:hypothetical protein
MQLGETIATYDLALALRGESGKFVVTSPAGETFHVNCKQDHSIVNLQWSGNGSNPQPFLIRKVAEPVPSSLPEKNGTSVNEIMQPRTGKTPFLIDVGDSVVKSDSREEQQSTSVAFQHNPNTGVVEYLDLFYQEADSDSEQPAAWVCFHNESQNESGKMVSNACTTFNELDTEIRRLHARLDDIRYRARKKFYQAQVIAPGA